MIGDLYSAQNVVVGQAAVFFAPNNTPLPSLANWNATDPFDPAFGLAYTITNGTATSFTLTYARDGKTGTTTTLTVAGLTPAAIAAALAGLASVGGAANVSVTGAASPWTVVFKGPAQNGVLTLTPTGGTATVTSPLWVACGATDQGWQFGANKSTQTIGIEEQSTPVATTVTSQAVTLGGSLSEDMTKTLSLALNANVAAVAPATTNPGYDNVTLTDTVLQYAVYAVMANQEGFGRIIYAPSWTQLSNVSVNLRRASDKRMYPVGFATVCNTNLIQILNFNAPHT